MSAYNVTKESLKWAILDGACSKGGCKGNAGGMPEECRVACL